jgi:tetrahydromethanopterin S-methyltransferase subunit G
MEEKEFYEIKERLQKLNERLQNLIVLFSIPYEKSELNPKVGDKI